MEVKFMWLCPIQHSSFNIHHSSFIIHHSTLFLDLNVEHNRVVVFVKRFIGTILSWLAVLLEENQCDLFERDRLSLLAETNDIGFSKTFHLHHFQHHGEVEVHVEQVAFPLDADNGSGVELKVFDFYFFHFLQIFALQNCEKNLDFEYFARKLQWIDAFLLILSIIKTLSEMRKNLIIIMLVLFAAPLFAQTIETVDVSKAPNGLFKTTAHDCTIEGTVLNGQKEGTWIEYYNSNTYLPKKIVNYQNGKRNGVFVEIDKTGSITKKAEYKNDKLDGQVSEWYRGGRLSKLNTYKEGVMEGQQILCYEKGGNLEVANYKNGQRDGLTTWYYENGSKKMTIEYKNGGFDGKQETFYNNGSIKSEATYKDGKLQGKKKTYEEKAKVANDTKKKQ